MMLKSRRPFGVVHCLIGAMALIWEGGSFQVAPPLGTVLHVGGVEGAVASEGPYGCTVVMAAKDGRVLVGNNEDRNFTETIVSFSPATEKFYGRVVFGYTDAPHQGGMNDQGLVVDGNAVRSTGWVKDPEKETYTWNVIAALLATCATCDDAREFFERYNVPGLDRARIPVADRSGASMIVEYSHGQVQFVTSETWYQIATNFVISNMPGQPYPCWRYTTADSMMAAAGRLSVELIRRVLEATHQEGRSLTVYSNIYDVKAGTVHLYALRDFEKAVVLRLSEELNKGERQIALSSLFEREADSGR